jgi:hypothetical protein
MLFNMAASTGTEKEELKGGLVQRFEHAHDDRRSSSQHAIPLLFVSHGYLQLQDNNKVLEMYVKCVAVGTLRTGYPHI